MSNAAKQGRDQHNMTVSPPVERNPLPTSYWEFRDARYADIPDVDFQIPGLLPVGLTVLVSPPKIGKSMLGMQIEHYLTAQESLFGYRAESRQWCLAVDLEGNMRRTRQRHWQLLPRFELAEAAQADTYYIHGNDPELAERYGARERIAWLGDYLDRAEASGYRIGHVRIDTLRLFLGEKPREMNAYDYDAKVGRWLDELAVQRNISILVPHHTRKSSGSDEDWLERVSGSTGIAGSASCIWLLDRNRGKPEGVIRVAPRDGEEAEVPVRFVGGKYSFADDITPAQARHTGGPRAVLDFLQEHRRATFSEIALGAGIEKKHLGMVIKRLYEAGEIESANSQWRIVPTGIGIQGELSDVIEDQADVADPTPDGKSSGELSSRNGSDQLADGKSSGDVESAAPEVNGSGRASGWNTAIPALLESIDQARAYAVPLIRADLRSQEPWTLAEGITNGRHRWLDPHLAAYAGGGWHVVLLDRNGAYPSVMSSVPVASSTLTHTADQPYDPDRAGLYLIRPPEWPDGPHPLGMAAGDGVIWVTAPAMDLLAKRGTLPEVLDSWTGRKTTALFERFHRWAKEARESATEDTYGDVKRQINIAIRSLWPRGVNDDGTPDNRGRMWRPDWWSAVVAEANVRHWVKADAARYHGRLVVSLANVDEIGLAIPGDAPTDLAELVHPYVLGTGYGQVKVKARLPLDEWVANGHRPKPRATRG